MSGTDPSTTDLRDPEQLLGRRGWRGGVRALFAAAAVVALAATGGTGFLAQTTALEQQRAIETTTALTEAADLEPDQLTVGDDILRSRVAGAADDALGDARAVAVSAAGKADAADLQATLAQLEAHALIEPTRVYDLMKVAKDQSAEVAAAVAEFDRLEAERLAAEQAAREAAARLAAEQATAERAAAERDAPSSPRAPAGTPAPPGNPSEAQAIARDMIAARYGWGEDQFGCLVAVWSYESGWRVNASNPSGAYGIPQALPGSKMSSHGADWQTNAATQISWGIDYIAGRYGNPCGAWAHIQSVGWY
ncbi:lytic transglycosylase domain-containing protein [Agromyces sp. CFH 90414]|uniref:Lytic transglycosylase domain-containing protein n=1 Tax=Agromyces agglutinans TaxID=2662258 RepID=A0A6I2FGM8_9MICO|nr:lytic transglycosylase domain-containing protein [Agromyces agglutinans]MRG60058.1 lytic transglycosylase domain-containing protein [Agromyces agglutinans]